MLSLVVTYGHDVLFVIVISGSEEYPGWVEVSCLSLLFFCSLSFSPMIKNSTELLRAFWQKLLASYRKVSPTSPWKARLSPLTFGFTCLLFIPLSKWNSDGLAHSSGPSPLASGCDGRMGIDAVLASGMWTVSPARVFPEKTHKRTRSLSDLKAYSKATVVKTEWYGHKKDDILLVNSCHSMTGTNTTS